MTSHKKVRYAVIGAGRISQEAFLPSVAQTGSSEVVAIVSGSLDKAGQLADFHGIPRVVPYEQFDTPARSGGIDAVYIATRNSSHARFAIQAAHIGCTSWSRSRWRSTSPRPNRCRRPRAWPAPTWSRPTGCTTTPAR